MPSRCLVKGLHRLCLPGVCTLKDVDRKQSEWVKCAVRSVVLENITAGGGDGVLMGTVKADQFSVRCLEVSSEGASKAGRGSAEAVRRGQVWRPSEPGVPDHLEQSE